MHSSPPASKPSQRSPIGCWMLDVGCWMLEVGSWMLDVVTPRREQDCPSSYGLPLPLHSLFLRLPGCGPGHDFLGFRPHGGPVKAQRRDAVTHPPFFCAFSVYRSSTCVCQRYSAVLDDDFFELRNTRNTRKGIQTSQFAVDLGSKRFGVHRRKGMLAASFFFAHFAFRGL